jgi:hypothetical protein
LTGRAGDFDFGFLNVQSKRVEEDPAENFTTMRVRRNFLDNSDFGFLFTNRMDAGEGSVGDYNRSFGTDLNLRPVRSLFINSYLAFTDTPGGGDGAARLAVGWRDRLWDTSAMFRHVGDDFEPGMGFVRRTGIRQYYATFGARPRPSALGILEVNPYFEADYITDLAGQRVSWDGTLGLGVTFRDGGRIALRYDDRRERLDEPFRVRPGVSIPTGDYHFGEAAASYRSSEGRKVSGSVGVSGGGYFDGDRFTITGGVVWQPDYHLTMEASAERNSLSAQGIDFTADLYSARVKYAFTTKLYVGAFVQYNADTDQVVTNARFRFIHAPLSDLFVVYTERRDMAGGPVLERIITVKFTRLFSF